MTTDDEPEAPMPTPATTDREFYTRHLEAAKKDLKATDCPRMKAFYKRIIARQTKNLETCE